MKLHAAITNRTPLNEEKHLFMKKKLLIVTTVPDTIHSILKGQPNFLNQYFDVSIATSPTELFERIKLEEMLPIYKIPMSRGIDIVRDFYSLILMVLLLLRIRPDIVHSYTPKAGLITMLAAKLCFIPIRIHTFTGLIFPTQQGIKKKILVFIDKIICACATKIIPESKGVKKDLEDHCITKKKLALIGHGNIAGVDTNFFSPDIGEVHYDAQHLRKTLNLPKDAFVFCFVGRLNKDKGITELENAFCHMPDNAYLLIVGDLDQSAPISSALYSKLTQNRRIVLLGFREDIRPALMLSTILILPSYREGFSNSILQAGSMGLPVIATDISGNNEVIESDFNGWIVPAKNSQALKNAMLLAMETPPENIFKMGNNARARIQQWFEKRQHWQRVKTFYFDETSI